VLASFSEAADKGTWRAGADGLSSDPKGPQGPGPGSVATVAAAAAAVLPPAGPVAYTVSVVPDGTYGMGLRLDVKNSAIIVDGFKRGPGGQVRPSFCSLTTTAASP
jgi:hypothetical protein